MTYSIEVREATHDGDDYTEDHYDFATPEEVKEFIKNEMSEDEHVHSVLLYADGQTSNPRDVTNQFKKQQVFKRR